MSCASFASHRFGLLMRSATLCVFATSNAAGPATLIVNDRASAGSSAENQHRCIVFEHGFKAHCSTHGLLSMGWQFG